MTDPDPGLPDVHDTDRFDVFLCFSRADPDGTTRMAEIDAALRDAGLRVFRDTVTGEFSPVPRELADAIACSRVVLVYYSRALLEGHVCQWALTAAFAAASRHGDPATRVLVVDPEPGDGHISPAELADAEFFTGPVTPRTLPTLVGRVRRKVADAAHPLGTGGGEPPLPRSAGRYRELWAVHDGLRTRSVLMVRGPRGVGKTALAGQYACLFHEAFGGGVLRLGPFGHHAPEEMLPQFHLALSRVAGDLLSADMSGMDFDRLRLHVAERIRATGKRTLVLVDDVPAGLPPNILDQLLLPAPEVSTVITSRTGRSPWDVATLDLTGLTPGEGLRLFGEHRAPREDTERQAILRYIDRCGGHPITVRATASAARHWPGPLDDLAFATSPDTAPHAIQDILAGLGRTASDVVRLGGLLAPVPFPFGYARDVLGLAVEQDFTEAVDELAARGVASRGDGGLRLQPLVAEAAGAQAGDLPDSAAKALLRLLSDDRIECRDFLLQHARALAERTSARYRIQLLRPIATAHEEHRDPLAAGEIHALILATEGAASTDFAAAARVEIACGLYPEAIGHARHALLLARTDAERYTARLVAARAFDCQGDYDAGDRTFWHEYARQVQGEDRFPVVVADAQASRLRGRPRDALASLETILPELREDLLLPALLEYARALLLEDHPRQAGRMAAEVAAAFHKTGRDRHFRCAEAELLRAEATVTLDLRNLRPDRSDRERFAADLRELESAYGKRHGPESALTLTVAAMAGRVLLALAQPDRALRALSETERTVLLVFGGEHPLRYRIRHGMALAHGQLREFRRQADLLEDILGPQIRLLGSAHPETLESRLDLGLALAFGERDTHATERVDSAADAILATHGIATELSAKAIAAKRAIRLPQPFDSAPFTARTVT
ncbi:TIR domain-containing protein [Amycolatopsis sp. NPDC089917]|uniref:TIR domain-containing protein n=1 Tax=Amycolatopsis sp. NPDC089917 TaxID=3155187 RepID=UPI0034331B5B